MRMHDHFQLIGFHHLWFVDFAARFKKKGIIYLPIVFLVGGLLSLWTLGKKIARTWQEE